MKYPPRGTSEAKNDFGGKLYPCKCGHAGHNHEISILHIFHKLIGGSVMGGKCKVCLCPYYKPDKNWNKTSEVLGK